MKSIADLQEKGIFAVHRHSIDHPLLKAEREVYIGLTTERVWQSNHNSIRYLCKRIKKTTDNATNSSGVHVVSR